MIQTDPSLTVYRSRTLNIGKFRCPARHPMWRLPNEVRDGHLVVFPRVPVRITHADGRGVVADPNCAMYYNKAQIYTREILCERGDECEWFAIDPEMIVAAAEEFDPAVRDRADRPFPFVHGPSDARTYLRQRQLCERVCSPTPPDPMFIEETFFDVLRTLVARAYGVLKVKNRRRGVATQRAHADTAEAAKSVVNDGFRQRLSLEEIAAAVYVSPYHLCRVFRSQTGFTVHQYVSHLRLRAALERLVEGNPDLTRLALEVGYSSHAHFTEAFSQAFGATPSAVRAAAKRDRLALDWFSEGRASRHGVQRGR